MWEADTAEGEEVRTLRGRARARSLMGWAMVTVSSVGYGDIYPVTTGGRLTAMLLMLIGVGVLGSYVAAITNYVVGNRSEPG